MQGNQVFKWFDRYTCPVSVSMYVHAYMYVRLDTILTALINQDFSSLKLQATFSFIVIYIYQCPSAEYFVHLF